MYTHIYVYIYAYKYEVITLNSFINYSLHSLANIISSSSPSKTYILCNSSMVIYLLILQASKVNHTQKENVLYDWV